MQLSPDIQQSAYAMYEGTIVLNSITNLDGKVIAKNTEKIVGTRQKSRQLARGY